MAEFERRFGAACDEVWQMWTEAERFASWYGPQGATIPECEFDVQVGGSRLVCMQMTTPDGPMQMWFSGEFHEVDAPNRLVYTDVMGKPDDADPAQASQVIVDLHADGDGTRMVVDHVGLPADSPGVAGWNMAFDKLVAALDGGQAG